MQNSPAQPSLFDAPAMPPFVGAEMLVAELILEATGEQPASIHWLQEQARFSGKAEISDRQVKKIVERLRDAGFIICASREKPCGYFLARTADEARNGLRAYWSQAISQIKKIRRLCATNGYKEIFGQLKLEAEAALKEEQ